MSDRDLREAALERLVREARTEKPEGIDFARIEERLLRQVRSAPAPAPRSHRPAWAMLAVAAGVGLWLVRSHTPPVAAPETRPRAVAVSNDPFSRDGDALGTGTRVTSAEHPLSVTHAGRATWRLAPNSSALLVEKGERITLRLERGSVLSEVVPSIKPETFVVEAAGARVAVHGTVFRVSLEGDRIAVRVREGVVAVGPQSAEPVFLLKAPAYGDFSSDGVSGSVNGQADTAKSSRPSEPSQVGRLHAARSATVEGRAAHPTPTAPLPKEPSIDDIEKGIALCVDIASGCFQRHTQSAEGVEVTVHTALSLQVTSSGAATDIAFQPPLSPDADACARTGIASVTFAASEHGTQVTRLLELKR
jgi:hypothetical protein